MKARFFLPAFLIPKIAFWTKTNLKLSKHFFTEMIVLMKHRKLIFEILLFTKYNSSDLLTAVISLSKNLIKFSEVKEMNIWATNNLKFAFGKFS